MTGPAPEHWDRISCLLPHIGGHKDVWKRVQRPRTPYPITRLDDLSDLVTTCPLPLLISSADFDTRRHLVSWRCWCDYIRDSKSSPSIRGARGFDSGREPHEDVAVPSSGVSRPNSLVGLVHCIVPWTMTRPPSIGTQKKASSLHGTTADGSPNLNKASLPRGDSAHVTTKRAVCDPHAIGPNMAGALKLSGPDRSAPDRRDVGTDRHRFWDPSTHSLHRGTDGLTE